MPRLPSLLLACTAAVLVSACTYVERDRPASQPTTVVIPQPVPQQPTIVQQAPPTITVRPSF